jgi:hypothetical protein
MSGFEVVTAGIRAAGNRGSRLLVAGAVLFTGLVLWLLLILFPGTSTASLRPGDLVRDLLASDNPALLNLFLVAGSVLVWAIWSAVNGAVGRGVVLEIRGQPATVGETLSFALSEWSSFFFAPLLIVFTMLGGAAIISILVDVTRIPAVGWPLLLLLSPVVLLVSFAVIGLSVRYLVGGHLIAPTIAAGNGGLFGSAFRALAYARRTPVRMVLEHLLALLLVLLHSVYRILVLGAAIVLPGLFIDWQSPSDLAVLCLLPLSLVLIAWLLAWPISLCCGARTGLYLKHRRDFDGVPIESAEDDPEKAKSLEDLGVELVRKLREEES